MTRAPAVFATCTASVPVPPAAASIRIVSPGSIRAMRLTSAIAVRPCTIAPAACSSSTSSGTGISIASGTATFSAYPPVPVSATTRRPSGVVPTTSVPGISGSSCPDK